MPSMTLRTSWTSPSRRVLTLVTPRQRGSSHHQDPAPLLLSRGTMKSLDIKLDFGSETLALGYDPPQKVQVNSAGQFVISAVTLWSWRLCGPTRFPRMTSFQDCPDEVLAGVSRNLTRREARCLLAKQPAWTKGDSKCLVAELFSPSRFAKLAREKGFEGLSYGILQGCDLLDKKTQAKVSKELDEANPELLVLSSECKHWGGWYRLNQTKLSLVEQAINKKKAEAQATFRVEQASQKADQTRRPRAHRTSLELRIAALSSYEKASQSNALVQGFNVRLWPQMPWFWPAYFEEHRLGRLARRHGLSWRSVPRTFRT